MKNKLFFTLSVVIMITSIIVVSCRKDKSEILTTTDNSSAAQDVNSGSGSAYKTTQDSGLYSRFISMNTANQMIISYVSSLNNMASTTNDIRSYSVSADSLRAYLANTQIKDLKLIFGHTMDYINDSNAGVYSGMKSGALTIIIAGYDTAGDYIYYGGASVLEHVLPCPFSCPPGDAASDYLQ